jgi:succinate dehydrogenase / fumarate reductase flavoprotein subunit
MGGIDVNDKLEVTGLKNCYAVGECSNAKVHGANRLGGNSLLEIVSLGRLAGNNACRSGCPHPDNQNNNQLQNDKEYIEGLFEEYPWEQNFYTLQDKLGNDFYKYAGIVRDNTELNNLLNELRVIKADIDNMGIGDKNRENNTNLIDFLQFQNLLEVGEVLLDASLVRDESRGAHFKTAFPDKDDKLYKAHSVYWIEENVLQNKLVKVK